MKVHFFSMPHVLHFKLNLRLFLAFFIILPFKIDAQTQEEFTAITTEVFVNAQDSLKARELAMESYKMVESYGELQTLSNYYVLKAIFDMLKDAEMAAECEKKGKAKIEFNTKVEKPDFYQNPQLEWAYEYQMELYKSEDPKLAGKALRFLEEHPELINFSNYSAIAYFYERIMDFDNAAIFYQKAFENIDYKNQEFVSLIMPAFFFMRSGNYEKVEECLHLNNELLKSANEYTRPGYESARDMIQMYYYLYIGDFQNYIQSADRYYEQQYRKQKENLVGNPYASIGKLNKAIGFENLGMYREAERFYRESEIASAAWLKAMKETYPNYKQESYPVLNTFLAKRGDLSTREDKLAELDRYYSFVESYSNPGVQQLFQKAIQYALFRDERYPALFEKVIRMSEDSRDFSSATQPYAEYACFLVRDRKWREANTMYQELFEKNLQWINDLIFTFGEKAFVAYFTTKLKAGYDNYHSFVKLTQSQNPVLHQKLSGYAYENLLLTKSIAFKGIRKRKKAFTNSNNPEIVALYEEWLRKKQRLIRLYQMLQEEKEGSEILPEADSFGITVSRQELEELQKETDLLENKLALASEGFKETLEISNHRWQELRASLNQGEAAIEMIRFQWRDQIYYSDTAYYAAYIIRHDSDAPEVVYLPTLATELDEKHYRFYRNSIQFKRDDQESYSQFWAPIKKSLKGVKKVYFSPDGIYHLINLSGLRNPETGEYLLEETELINVTSTAAIVSKKSSPSPGEAVLIGRPKYSTNNDSLDMNKIKERSFSRDFRNASVADLPGTELEVSAIRSQLQREGLQVEALIGAEAKEDRLYELQSPDILHIATHGFWSGTENASAGFRIFNAMMNSGLLMAGVVDYYNSDELKDSNDGILTAYEAQNLNLEGTDLVVLSACETGLGKLDAGEGIYGLQRAFRTAGAQSVITTLWKIDDEASKDFMIAFYKNMLTDKARREAFRNAQMEMKEKYRHPYYWAAFVLTGN